MKPIIFNIVSGKGGTGKTLLTTVLANAIGQSTTDRGEHPNVLVIDLDIFVRGLTTMFYYQNDQRDILTNQDEFSTSDFFMRKVNSSEKKLSIQLYNNQSFSIVPAVNEISQTYIYHDIMPNNIGEALDIIGQILDNAQRTDPTLDYIFLDSRAGYDEVVAAAYLLSTYSICVDEDDSISLVTADNLIRQFDSLNNSTIKELLKSKGISTDLNRLRVYRLRNKTRNYSIDNENSANSMGINFLGFIPFDGDVMRSFGSKQFWNTITNTLYMEGVCNAWNTLANKQGLTPMLDYYHPSSIGSKKIEKRLSALPTLSRMGYLYGFLLLFLGAFLISIQSGFWGTILNGDPYLIIGLIVVATGIFFLLASVMNLTGLNKGSHPRSENSKSTKGKR